MGFTNDMVLEVVLFVKGKQSVTRHLATVLGRRRFLQSSPADWSVPFQLQKTSRVFWPTAPHVPLHWKAVALRNYSVLCTYVGTAAVYNKINFETFLSHLGPVSRPPSAFALLVPARLGSSGLQHCLTEPLVNRLILARTTNHLTVQYA